MKHFFPLVLPLAVALLFSSGESSGETAPDPHAAPQVDPAAAMREIDPGRIIAAIEANPERFPWIHSMVIDTEPGMLAQRLGISPGARVLSRGGRSMSRFDNIMAAGEIAWVDAKGGFHQDHADAGEIGFHSFIGRDFTPWYVLRGNRNPDWDHQVVSALAMHERSPERAGRFWEQAMQNGYPEDHLSNLCGMWIACAVGDPERAAAHAEAFGSLETAPDGLPFWESDWQQVAAVTGDYGWMDAAGDHFHRLHPESELVRRHDDVANLQALAAGEPGPPPAEPPSALAAGMRRTSILPDLNTDSPWTYEESNTARMHREMFDAALEAQRKGADAFPAKSISQFRDAMYKSWCGPMEKARDMDMRIEFRVKPTAGASPCKYYREFHIGLANRTMYGGMNQAQVPPSARILSVCFGFATSSPPDISYINAIIPSRRAWSTLGLRMNPFQLGGRGMFAHVRDHRPEPGGKHILRVVRVGKQAEAILDGKRLALVHVPPHLDDIGVNWFVSGVEVTVTSFQADMLH